MDVQLTDVKQVSFSLDGSKLMVVSSQSDPKKPQIQVIDPLMMKQVAIKGIVNDDSKYVEAVFSPNGQMVLTGGSDGDLRAFDADTGNDIWRGKFHPKNLHRLCVSYKYCLIATSCHTASVWCPDE